MQDRVQTIVKGTIPGRNEKKNHRIFFVFKVVVSALERPSELKLWEFVDGQTSGRLARRPGVCQNSP